MNKTLTPYLLAAVILLGLLAFLSERPRRSGGSRPRGGANVVVRVNPEDILRLRMRRDFWNSYTLAKNENGRWIMEEPSRGDVQEAPVRQLLETLTMLPVLQVLDMPGDDSERYREYGLWEPSLEMTISATDGVTTLMFGAKTSDESGIYATVHGISRVYVIPAAAYAILQRGVDDYRTGP